MQVGDELHSEPVPLHTDILQGLARPPPLNGNRTSLQPSECIHCFAELKSEAQSMAPASMRNSSRARRGPCANQRRRRPPTWTFLARSLARVKRSFGTSTLLVHAASGGVEGGKNWPRPTSTASTSMPIRSRANWWTDFCKKPTSRVWVYRLEMAGRVWRRRHRTVSKLR